MGDDAHPLQPGEDLSEVFLAERHALLAFIYSLVGDAAAAEDVFQEVWLRLADAMRRKVPIAEPRGWFRGVARNLVLHRWRNAARTRVVVDSGLVDLFEEAFAEYPEPASAFTERRQALATCLDGLPADARQVLDLTYGADWDAARVAERMHRSVAGVYKQLSRLRQALASCIERRLAADGATS